MTLKYPYIVQYLDDDDEEQEIHCKTFVKAQNCARDMSKIYNSASVYSTRMSGKPINHYEDGKKL